MKLLVEKRKIKIEENELYPYYEISDINKDTLSIDTFEVPKELYNRYFKNIREFREIQNKLKNIYKQRWN